jgi:hypothetical protein
MHYVMSSSYLSVSAVFFFVYFGLSLAATAVVIPVVGWLQWFCVIDNSLVRLYLLSQWTQPSESFHRLHESQLFCTLCSMGCQELSCTAFSAYVSRIFYPSMQKTYISVVRILVQFAKVVCSNPTRYSLHVGFSEK